MNRRTVLHVAAIAILVALVLPFVAFAVPQTVGAEHSYVVMSSSMSPEIDAGDAVLVAETSAEHVEEGDVIVFQAAGPVEAQTDQTDVITHRVESVEETDGERQFRTKGDANEEPDAVPVTEDQLIGEVRYTVPYMGYAVEFLSSTLGFVLFVVFPLGALVLTEVRELVRAWR